MKNGINKYKIGILGFGEVGSAVAKFYKNPKIKDLKRDDDLLGVDVLNICIPWSKNFINLVKKEIQSVNPKLTIIHSTVEPGTTKKLADIFNGMVVHSPIRGTHPDLFKGVKIFTKYIGADNKKAGVLAKKHLESVGMKTRVFPYSKTTEIGKLFDTTYYGVCIAWHGEMKRVCEGLGIDFDQAVTDFNKTYNDGYAKIGKKNVVRPVLYPPTGRIGGHCIVPNAKILRKYLKSKAIDLILDYAL